MKKKKIMVLLKILGCTAFLTVIAIVILNSKPVKDLLTKQKLLANFEDLYGRKFEDAYFKIADYNMYDDYIRAYGINIDENAKYISFSVTNDNKTYYKGFADEKSL